MMSLCHASGTDGNMDFQPQVAVFTNSRHGERLQRRYGRANVVDEYHPTAFDMTRRQALMPPVSAQPESGWAPSTAQACALEPDSKFDKVEFSGTEPAAQTLSQISIYQEVRALKIAGTVAARMVMSSPSDQFSTYSVPSSARFEKGRSLRPRTCQRPVIPGRATS